MLSKMDQWNLLLNWVLLAPMKAGIGALSGIEENEG